MGTPTAGGAPLGRPSWTGSITFGLVAVPVRLYPATETHAGPELHEYHREDASRVRRRRYCLAEDVEVAYEDIARGWETPDGRMVVLTDEDMEQLPLPSAHVIDVHAFIPESAINALSWDSPYFVGLAEKAPAKPYALLCRAMRESGTVAVTKVAMRSRESLAVLRPQGDLLVLQTIRWPDEIRSSEGIRRPDPSEAVHAQEIKMARQLMDSMSEGYDLDAERDAYTQALAQLLAAKAGGGQVEAAPEAAAPVPSLDLMAALRTSIEESQAKRAADAPPKPAKKTATKKPPAKRRAS